MEVNAENFHSLISKLNKSESEWTDIAELIRSTLAEEMHSDNPQQDAIKKVRDQYEFERQNSISKAKAKFQKGVDLDKLDEQLEQFSWDLFLINKQIQDYINYDLINIISNLPEGLLDKCPCTLIAVDALTTWQMESTTRDRFASIFSKVVYESTAQSGVSNAGNAGEMMVEELLEAAGLQEGGSYKTQYKSEGEGSNTDFVFPYVADERDQDVEIFLAVQFSTNDRLRMVSSELKAGGNGYVFNATGTRAASKGLKDIGTDVIQTLKNKNQKLICHKVILDEFIEKLSIDSQKRTKKGDLHLNAHKSAIKLDYYRNYTMTWSDFAKLVKKRFAS